MRWQLQRVEVNPEDAGLCGCAQFIIVRRDRLPLPKTNDAESGPEYAYYVTSRTKAEMSARELAEAVRGHWGACENGAHYRRDVTLGEDACQISGTRAFVVATLRNMVLGLFELQKERGKTQAEYLPEWRRKMTLSMAIKLIKGG